MDSTKLLMLLAIVAYLAVVVGIGAVLAKRNRTTEDFYLGGRKLGPFVTAMSAEASDMSGIRVTDLESAQAAAKKIHAMGVPNVLITLGHRGAALYDGKDFIFRPAVSGVQAVDPTAAGDSFVGAFCTAVCSGLSAPDALVFANHTAALTVTRIGAMPSLPHLEEVQDFLKEKEPSWPK